MGAFLPTIFQMKSLRRHQALEFFKPVLDDDDWLRFRCLLSWLQHQEPLAVRGKVVVSTARV